MSERRWCLLVIGDERGRARSLASADGLEQPPDDVVVSERGEPAPWADTDVGVVVFLRSGDELVAEHLATRLSSVDDRPISVGGHHCRGGRWDLRLPPKPPGLTPPSLLLHGAIELSTLTTRRDALPEEVEIPPDVPGGDRWLLAHLAREVSLHRLEVPVATIIERGSSGAVESASRLAASRLAHDLGIAAAARDALMEHTWLSIEQASVPPDRWWMPVLERADHGEMEQLCHDFERSLDQLRARLKSAADGIDVVIAEQGIPDPPSAWYLAGDLDNARLEIETLRSEVEHLRDQLVQREESDR